METAAIIGATLGLPVTVLGAVPGDQCRGAGGAAANGGKLAAPQQHLRAWVRGDYALAFPGGEDYYTLYARAMVGYRTVLDQPPRPEGRHRRPRRHLHLHHQGALPEVDLLALLQQENHNCSITEVQLAAGPTRLLRGVHGRLVRWAGADHLTGYAAEVVCADAGQSIFCRTAPLEWLEHHQAIWCA